MKTKSLEINQENIKEYKFSGIASSYGDNDRDNDTIEKGAFINFKTSESVIVPLFYNHDPMKVIGKVKLVEEDLEIKAYAEINQKNELGAQVYELIEFGALSSLSIGFSALDYELKNFQNPMDGVIIKKAEILEVSVVAIPANPNAMINSVKTFTNEEINILLNAAITKSVNEKHLDDLEDYRKSLLKRMN